MRSHLANQIGQQNSRPFCFQIPNQSLSNTNRSSNMNLCKCLKQNIMYAWTALQMTCKIIEMIQLSSTYLSTDPTKLGLYKRVTMTVVWEPPTGTDCKQVWGTILCFLQAYISIKHVCIFASQKERTHFTTGWCYLKMNQISQKICKILIASFHLCS